MVKKLLKQEYNYYIRTLVFILPVVLLLGISNRFVQLFEFDHSIYYMIYGLSVMLLFVASIAAIIATEVLAIVRFYKNMYSAEGYLTFTLPVSNHQHIISKLIAHIVSMTATVIVVAVAWLIAFSGVDAFAEIFPELAELFKQIYSGEFIWDAIFITLEIIVIYVFSAISSPLLYYACISIGQLAKKNRILLAIAAYYIYNMIVQVLATIFGIFIVILGTLGVFESLAPIIENNPIAVIHVILCASIVLFAGLAALFYYINIRIMNNKLNLE